MPRRRSLFVVSIGLVGALTVAALASLNRDERPVGLADYLGWRDAATPAMAVRETQVAQRWIADCMAGLDLPFVEFVEPPLDVPDADLGPREWAAKWGFGVSTSVGVGEMSTPASDPNLAHIESLPPGERDAYRAALFGTPRSRGCSDEANDKVYGRHDRLLAGLATELAGLDDQIAADPRTTDADARWRSCAGSSAFAPSSREAFGREAIAFVGGRLEATMGRPSGDDEVERAALERLQALEIELAVRGIDCDDAVRPVLDRVRLEYEARFVESHRAALDNLKARALALDAELGLEPAPPSDPVSFEP